MTVNQRAAHFSTNRGFSLLELLVALSLSSLVLGMSLPIIQTTFALYQALLTFTSDAGDLDHVRRVLRDEFDLTPLYRGAPTRVVLDEERRSRRNDPEMHFLQSLFHARTRQIPSSASAPAIALIRYDPALRFVFVDAHLACFDRALAQLPVHSRRRLFQLDSPIHGALVIFLGHSELQSVTMPLLQSHAGTGRPSSHGNRVCIPLTVASSPQGSVPVGGLVIADISYFYLDRANTLRLVRVEGGQNHPLAQELDRWEVQQSPESGRAILTFGRNREGDSRVTVRDENSLVYQFPFAVGLQQTNVYESVYVALDLLE